jgi:acyl carrier protein
MEAKLEDRVRRLLGDVVGVPVDKLALTAPLNQLDGWESLNLVNLMIALEDEFKLSFSPEQAGELNSIDGIARILTSIGAK